MKYLVLLATIFNLAGCMELSYCYQKFSAGGMEFCIQYETENDFDLENIELVVQVVEEEAYTYYPQVRNLKNRLSLSGTEVYITPDYLVRNCSSTEVPMVSKCENALNGINYMGSSSRIIVRASSTDGCVRQDTLAHEILHSVHFFYAIDLSETHATEYFFVKNYENPEDQKETIEYRAEQRLKNTCKYETLQ